MSILNVNQLQPVGGGNTITVGSSNIDYSGSITGNISVDGNLTVTGVVSQEDITNIDSVGVITARAGVNVSGGQLDVGSNIKLGNAGVITATSYRGDGSQLTGISVDSTKIETGNTKVETIDTGSDGHVKITTEGTERLRITSAGSVGIGTDNPTKDLTITGNNPGILLKEDSANSELLLTVNDSDGTGVIAATRPSNYTYEQLAIRGQDLIFETTSTQSRVERLRITSAGGVGIGTDVPGAKLEVFDETSNTILNVKSGDAGAVLNLIDPSQRSSIEQNGTTLKIISDTGAEFANSDIRLQVDGSTKMRVQSTGNIAIDNGDLVFSTSGTGIDFSATSDGSGTTSSELFDDYEEGTWTPTMNYATGYGTQSGTYVKVGKTVHVWFEIQVTGWSTGTASTWIRNTPFGIDKVTGCWAAVINGVSTTTDWRIGPWSASSNGLGVWMSGGQGSSSSTGIRMTTTSFGNYSSLTGSLGTSFTMRGGFTFISTT